MELTGKETVFHCLTPKQRIYLDIKNVLDFVLALGMMVVLAVPMAVLALARNSA